MGILGLTRGQFIVGPALVALAWYVSGWRGPLPRREAPAAPAMGISEAYAVLGLRDGATEAEIRDAHRALIQKLHPDKGGTSYLAAKLNAARDLLLKQR